MYVIEHIFEKDIRGDMYASINSTMNKDSRKSCALLLSVYTEILGGFVTGNLKDKSQMRQNYEAFLSYLGVEYREFHKKHDTYTRIRNGLVHEFGPKKQYVIWLTETPQRETGFEYVPEMDLIHFHLQEYFRDFKKGVDLYYEQLIKENRKNLIEKFLNTLNKFTF